MANHSSRLFSKARFTPNKYRYSDSIFDSRKYPIPLQYIGLEACLSRLYFRLTVILTKRATSILQTGSYERLDLVVHLMRFRVWFRFTKLYDKVKMQVDFVWRNQSNQSERKLNRTQSNSNRSIVFRLVRQSNIIEQERFGEFEYRTREFDFRT